jgi:hypothetical protein
MGLAARDELGSRAAGLMPAHITATQGADFTVHVDGRRGEGEYGNLWFTEGTFGGFARITPTGTITKYGFDPGGITTPTGITFGPGGDAWVTESHIVRKFSFPLVASSNVANTPFRFDATFAPKCISFATLSGGITVGPDGNLWVTASDQLIRIAPNSTQCSGISYFPFSYSNGSAGGVTTGCDGNLWYTDTGTSAIGKLGFPGPRVLSISSTDPDGAYLTGASVSISVTFDAPVAVAGTPKLTLNSGGVASYSSGSGTNTLTFIYTVLAGETAVKLDVASDTSFIAATCPSKAMALSLNGGTLRDSGGNDAILLVPVSPAAGSLADSKAIAINPADSTSPTSSAVASPLPNANGWNRSDVTVTISATDLSGSGVKQIQYALAGAQNTGAMTISGSTATLIISNEGTTTVTYYATDNVGNLEAAKTLSIRLDKIGPVVTFAAATPAPNAAGWNNANVSVPFAVSDSLSGVETVSSASPLVLTAEGSAVFASVTVTDRAGNSVTSTSPSVKIDKTPPLIAGARSPLANANGWNKTAVTISFSCTDSLSGLAAGSPPTDAVLSSDGTNQSVNGTCQDVAGNSASVTVTDINIDRTPPTASASALPAASANGWNSSNVTVSFTGTDSLSGIDSYTAPVVLSVEGVGQSASGTCTDKAGNVSLQATKTGIKIDKKVPVISGMPAMGCTLWPPNHKMTEVATVTASDTLSGVAPSTFKVTGTSNEPSDPKDPDIVITPNASGGFVVQLRAERLGTGTGRVYTLTAASADLAGNATTTTATCTVPHGE